MTSNKNIVGAAILGLLIGFVTYRGISAPPEILKKSIQVDYESIPVLTLVADEKVLTPALKNLGTRKVIEKLVRESEGGSAFDCHQEAHKIGRVSYALSKEKSFTECDASCHSGCYHGAMESFLNEKGTADIAENIDSVCSLFATNFENFECLHGVGHGLLAYVDYDMLATVADCKKLKDWFSTVSCYGGMFMENILTGQGLGASLRPGHETKWISSDPHFPCNGLPADDHDLIYQCYQMQTSWMLTLFAYDFKKVKEECLRAREDMIPVCFRSFGRDAAGNSLRDPQKMKEACNMVPRFKQYYEECVTGGVNVIVDFWGPALGAQAVDFCSILDAQGKAACYGTLSWRIPQLFNSKEDQVNMCDRFEEDYKHVCSKNI